jgi:hypothetical protein
MDIRNSVRMLYSISLLTELLKSNTWRTVQLHFISFLVSKEWKWFDQLDLLRRNPQRRYQIISSTSWLNLGKGMSNNDVSWYIIEKVLLCFPQTGSTTDLFNFCGYTNPYSKQNQYVCASQNATFYYLLTSSVLSEHDQYMAIYRLTFSSFQ